MTGKEKPSAFTTAHAASSYGRCTLPTLMEFKAFCLKVMKNFSEVSKIVDAIARVWGKEFD